MEHKPPRTRVIVKTSSTDAAPRVVALGAAAEEFQSLGAVLAKLPASFPAPIIVAQHWTPLSSAPPLSPSRVADIMSRRTALRVKEAQEGDRLQAGTVYVAPPAGRLMVCPDDRLSLSEAEKGHSRSAVDALFLSLADSLQARAIGVMLAGGEDIGAAGIQAIKSAGGVTLAQAEKARRSVGQPRRAAAGEHVDFVLTLPEIAATLAALVSEPAGLSSAPEASSLERKGFSAMPDTAHSDTKPRIAELSPAVATALDRVQEAWRRAEDFPGSGAGTQQPSRLMAKALEELDDCVDALRFAEQLLRSQNNAMELLQQTIREERWRYQMLLEIVSEAVIMTDLHGIIRAVNPAAAQVLGRNPKYMLSRPLKKYAQYGQLPAPEQLLAAENVSDLALGLRTRSGATAVTATASAIENDHGILIGLHWLCRETSA